MRRRFVPQLYQATSDLQPLLDETKMTRCTGRAIAILQRTSQRAGFLTRTPKALPAETPLVTISATRQCWSERKGKCDSQEIRKSRPAGESPVRLELSQQVGSEFCGVNGNVEADA